MNTAVAGTRPLLYAAAAFNLGAVLILVPCVRLAPQVLGLDAMSASQRLYADLAAWLIACFGLGYALAGVDFRRFWPCVALGTVGKVGVVVLAAAYVASGAAGPVVAALASGDAIFAVLFVRLLHRHGLVARTVQEGQP